MEWPGGKSAEPNEILLDFLGKLPATIKDSVLFQCCFGMQIFDLTALVGGDYLTELRKLLNEYDDASRAYKCAQLIGVVELVLEPDVTDLEKLNQELYEETGGEAFRNIAMRQPLSKRHSELARKEFQELRQVALSAQALHMWQELLRLSSQVGENNK